MVLLEKLTFKWLRVSDSKVIRFDVSDNEEIAIKLGKLKS